MGKMVLFYIPFDNEIGIFEKRVSWQMYLLK
jgi:hypothetical protein